MRSKSIIIATTATAVVSALGGYVWREEHRPAVLEVYVFSLKSGHSAFIRTPEDRRILIDGGANSGIIRELTKILPFYSRRIDTLIATDTDGKDISGLVDILERYAVDRVFVPAVTLQSLGLASSTDRIYETFLETAAHKKIPVYEIGASGRIDFSPKVSADILFPASSDDFAYSKASAPELLMKISYGDTSVTFLGNASVKVQKYLATSSSPFTNGHENVDSTDALIVSHSALPANMFPGLMNELQPQFLIYSKMITKTPAKPPAKKSSAKSSSSKKKPPADPFAAILDENRFNLKEVGTVKMVSDGKGIEVGPK